jgi:hypothetical protein
MQYHHHESERKARKRPPGRDNPKPGEFRHRGVYKTPQPTAATQYAVYDGRDRLGAYRRDGETFTAFNRLGREIGSFNSEQAAIAAIDSEVMS